MDETGRKRLGGGEGDINSSSTASDDCGRGDNDNRSGELVFKKSKVDEEQVENYFEPETETSGDFVRGDDRKGGMAPIPSMSIEDGKQKENSEPGTSAPTLNPLLIGLVLERLFPYVSYLNGSMKYTQNLRLVCKTWNSELTQMNRSRSEIDVRRLVTPYPEGLGWKDEILKDGESRWMYNCPMEITSQFENIKMGGDGCAIFKDPQVISWFSRMGSHVKRLRLQCSLACYHHTRFLECVLKRWCKNLKVLYLDGIAWYSGFSHYSRFVDSPFICTLDEIIIRGVEEMDLNQGGDCCADLADVYLPFSDNSDPMRRKVNVFDTNPGLLGDLETILRQSLEVAAMNLHHFDSMPNIAELIDGGVLGQLMENLGARKLNIVNLPMERSDAFLLSLIRKPKKIMQMLEEFEYGDFPMFMWGWQLSTMKIFKLTKICIGPISTKIDGSDISTLLELCSDTLKHVEFDGRILAADWSYANLANNDDDNDYIWLDVPELPNLKVFENRDIFCTRLLGGMDFVKKFPLLERCSLTNVISHPSQHPMDHHEVFNMLFQGANFEPDEVHALKELRLLGGKISFGRHVQLLSSWFPHLTTVEVTLDGADVFVDFIYWMSTLESVEDLKISFNANDAEWCNAGLANHLRDMKNLQFLELIYLSDSPLRISANTCEQAFCEASKLTSLKVANFAMFVDEEPRIRELLSKLSHVQFSNCVLMQRPIDFEMSVGTCGKLETVD